MQILTLCTNPELLESPDFPGDVKSRAKALLAAASGSVGAYTDSKGVELIRQHCAEYIEKRDGHPCNPEHISLTSGASEGIKVQTDTYE